jgi:choline/glycine/proline betaine transport protein
MVGRYLREHTNPPVFLVSAGITIGLLIITALFFGSVSSAFTAINSFIYETFGWVYILGASAILIFVLWLLFSRYGNIKLGPDDSRPEFSTWGWFAMLFTAGMGIGLVFFGVAEPVTHFQSPPTGQGGTATAAQTGMDYTFFHWGLHPWAVYIVIGLALGYFSFRRGLPMRPASALYPLIGNRIYGPIGNTVDILAVFGTLFGLAASLGIGAQQVGAGMESVFGVSNSTTLQIVLIAIITGVAAMSVMLGIDKGIRRLSQLAMIFGAVMLVIVFVFGPTLYMLNALPTNLGSYLQTLPQTSFQLFPNSPAGREWQGGWTLFYWAWWISWSPFVGMFIARVSYGRTIKQFILGVLFAPVGASLIWFTVFGSGAQNLLLNGEGGPLANAASSDTMIYGYFEALGFGGIALIAMSILTMVTVILFFATSSDSGSLVIDILTNGGDPNPMWQQRLFWAVIEGVVAATLLGIGAAAGGDALGALQTASLIAGLPFAIVLLIIAFGLVKGLREERMPSKTPDPVKDSAPPSPGRSAARPQGVKVNQATAQDSQQRGENRTD